MHNRVLKERIAREELSDAFRNDTIITLILKYRNYTKL
jgi:hypothetical protein